MWATETPEGRRKKNRKKKKVCNPLRGSRQGTPQLQHVPVLMRMLHDHLGLNKLSDVILETLFNQNI